jgi:hypothetical protein
MRDKVEAGQQVLKHLPPFTDTRSLGDRAWLNPFKHFSGQILLRVLKPGKLEGKFILLADHASTDTFLAEG